MKLCVPAKVAGCGDFILLLVVLVHGESELRVRIAHGIGTIDPSGGVGGDTVASIGVKTTDSAEKNGSFITRKTVVGDAGKGRDHAAADIGVGDGWEVVGGSPGSTGCRAGLR